MARLTITVDEQTLRRLRIEAIRHNTSVSRFVGQILHEKLRGDDDTYERAMADFFSRSPYLARPKGEDRRSWPTRSEIHDRPILR